MNTIKSIPLLAFGLLIAGTVHGQIRIETFSVSGNCRMCKSKIEKAAKEAGAQKASWDVNTKLLTVSYKSSKTNIDRIQKKIAEAGYDNAGFKATNEAYQKLHGCCKYDRGSREKSTCCSDKCEMINGKCKDVNQCKQKGCCKDEEKCKENGCCKAAFKKTGQLQKRA